MLQCHPPKYNEELLRSAKETLVSRAKPVDVVRETNPANLLKNIMESGFYALNRLLMYTGKSCEPAVLSCEGGPGRFRGPQ